MKKVFLLLLFVLIANCSFGQLIRYVDTIFEGTNVTKDIAYGANVPYSSNDVDTLRMDIYEPSGDTMSERPVLIFIHSGSFLSPGLSPKQPSGTREDNWLVETCTRFAQKGYVCVSLDHRLGWNPFENTQELRTQSIMKAVWRAMQDFRAAVRFLRHSADAGNPYKINPDIIAAGGSSSGAYVAIHSEFLDKPAELTLSKFTTEQGDPMIDTLTLGNNDGVRDTFPYGTSFDAAYFNYSPEVDLVFCLGGAIADTSLVEGDGTEPPIIAVHGTNDATTPYGTATVFTAIGNYAIIEVSGSKDFVRKAHEKGLQAPLISAGFNDEPTPGLKPFYGQGFQAYNWYNGDSAAAVETSHLYLDSMITFLTPRTKAVLGLADIEYDSMVTARSKSFDLGAKVYPSPANSTVYIQVANNLNISYVEVLDINGKPSKANYKTNANIAEIDVRNLVEGVYFVRYFAGEHSQITKIIVTK